MKFLGRSVDQIMAFLGHLFGWSGVPVDVQNKPQTPVLVQNVPASPSDPVKIETMTKAQILYNTAKASLGRDMSPLDKAPDSLACMESVDGVWLVAFGEHLLPLPARLSTEAGYQAMLQDSRLQKVETPTPGCIVISPTGYSSKGSQHGHTGIWGQYDVMSNDSNSGHFLDNYTHLAWYNVFNKSLGFPVYFFLPVG